MLATVWSPTWVIDGRDPARTPQPHESEMRPVVEEEHRLGMLLCPRSGVGRGMALCHTPVSRRTAARRIVQCAKPGKPPAAYGCRQGTQFPKGGGYMTGTWSRVHFTHRTGR